MYYFYGLNCVKLGKILFKWLLENWVSFGQKLGLKPRILPLISPAPRGLRSAAGPCTRTRAAGPAQRRGALRADALRGACTAPRGSSPVLAILAHLHDFEHVLSRF